MDVTSFGKVCPACNKPLDHHSIDELLKCGLIIANSFESKRTVMADPFFGTESAMNNSKDVSENVS